MPFQVLLFYKYITIENPKGFADWFRAQAERYHLKGRAIIAQEGLNATLEGEKGGIEQFIQDLKQDLRFVDLKVKRSIGTGSSFPKLVVKVRQEIVGTHFSLADADPRVRTAPRLSPEKLRSMYQKNDDFVVIDMRNSYEFASGHFKNSIDPGLRASRDLEKAIFKLEPYKSKKIVTVCTGGIRCEKMSAYLLSKGFTDVHQLEDGIHAYMEKYPGQDFLGTLYTFDNRVVMDFGGEREMVGTCRSCGQKTERYLNCAHGDCHLHMVMCASCAPQEKAAFCSKPCKLQHDIDKAKQYIHHSLSPVDSYFRRKKRHLHKQYHRCRWKIRRFIFSPHREGKTSLR